MKLNNKGFTVVELLASFVLTMVIVVFLFEIVLELKNVYINESLKTEVVTKNAAIATSIHKMLDDRAINNVNCGGNFCTIQFFTSTGGFENKTISVSGNTITVGNQKIVYPTKTNVKNASLGISPASDGANHNSIIQLKYTVESDDLVKDINFNYIYTYKR